MASIFMSDYNLWEKLTFNDFTMDINLLINIEFHAVNMS